MTQSLKIKWLTWVVFSYERWLLSGTCFNCCAYTQQRRFGDENENEGYEND